MTTEAFDTLAYSQSPKTTKRTTFQDELEAALTVRARKKTPFLYSEDLDEAGDDFLDTLLKTRKNRSDAFKASKTKSRINDFEFSDDDDDDDETQGTKNSSFLKSLKRISFEADTFAPPSEHEVTTRCQLSNEDAVRDNSGTLRSSQSDDVPPDLPLPFHSSTSPTPIRLDSRADTSRETFCNESFRSSLDPDLKCVPTAGIQQETPKPKPRQRTMGLNIGVTEKNGNFPSGPLAANIGNVADVSSERMPTRSRSPQWTDGCCADSSVSNDVTVGDTKGQELAHTTFGKEANVRCREITPLLRSLKLKTNLILGEASSSQSQRPSTAHNKKVESKYLGTLKILDSKISQDCQPQSADYVRATVYQEWLRKKKEKSSENLNKEKLLQEQNKKREEEKKKDAAASYEAWKAKKTELLKAKTKTDKHKMSKEQRAVEEVEEKRKEAEQVFYQWKREHDELLREKYQQQRATERKLALKKQKEEEERKKDSKSAFSNWCEKKTDALSKRVSTESLESRNKAEEHQYIQEKDKMAIETFEQWLAKKDMQQKRQREERRIQVILRDSPPPPWSPPNKTIQFRK
ncbi:microtubule-associated protein 9 [Syngnathus acus]|uniref:microtubule-associated protein 9 n=1 Tax=Syngnathus acus TaxID=161584 RepID=UPI0018862F9B|nr:microtubule-associated protein 9 [Syngnathus acus]